MKEKIIAFFQNEKLKGVARKVFNKKTLVAAAVVVVIAVALRITFFALFIVEGVVNKVDGSKITVVNFLTTKTVDIGTFQTTSNSIQIGDKIKIVKNLSGEVMSVRDENRGYKAGRGNLINNGKQNSKGVDGRNSMRKR